MLMHHDLVDTKDALPLDYWRNPESVPVDGDDLSFLYIPDYAEHMIVTWLAQEVFAFQRTHARHQRQMTKMVMITMGALLPGVLLHDAVTYGAEGDMPPVEFGTFGVRFYEGPGKPLAQPSIVQPLSIDVHGQVVGIVEDLADLGRTAQYIQSVLCSEPYGARETVLIATYRKSATTKFDMEVITFGIVPAHTWIITPRERIETMIKRVPYWALQGLSQSECRANLEKIGYPPYLIDSWFEVAWRKASQ
jgi:hypoxanthine-guanine phosphoribosyltransferase